MKSTDKTSQRKIIVNNEDIENVTNFEYLGFIINNDEADR